MRNFLIIIFSYFSLSISAQETVIDSAKTKIEKYYNTGLSDSLRADYKGKIAHMDKYIAKDSINPEAFLQRGIYYSLLGLSVEAILDYDKSLALNEEQPIAYFNRGIAKARFRYTYEACYDFKKSYLLGVNQAAKVYDVNCKLYQKKIDDEVAQN
jgi:tetratricopeptide (TPR) repeat protein